MNLIPVCCEMCGKLVAEANLGDGEEYDFIAALKNGKFLVPFLVDANGNIVVCRECKVKAES